MLGHINKRLKDGLSVILVKKIDEEEQNYNLLLRGKNESDSYVLANDLNEEQLKWYVYGLSDGIVMESSEQQQEKSAG